MKVVIDTNVVLDFALERVPFQDEAKKIFQAIDEHYVTGYLLASAVTDIYYFISKAY
jgi:predicted nucleic acid-binding protein